MPLPRWLTEARGLRADLTALASGAATALALPPLHVLPVLLATFPILLMQIASARRATEAARRGWCFGFGYHLIGLYWITEAILFEAARFWWLVPLAVPALSAVLATFIAIPAGVAWLAAPRTCRPDRPDLQPNPNPRVRISVAQVMTLAGGWVLADLARQFVATGFPWNPLGSVWAAPGRFGDVMSQPASLVSVHGLTLLTIAVACAPVLRRPGRALCCAIFAAWIGFGVYRTTEPPPADQSLRVVLVQGNVPQGQKWDPAFRNEVFEKYLRLTDEGTRAAGAGPHVAIWPETASPFLLDVTAREAIAKAGNGGPVLVGAVRFDSDDRPRNALIAVSPSGTAEALYDKWHLVPFGEYQPVWARIGIQLVPGDGFGAGPGPRTLRVTGAPPFGPLICYEAIFPGEVVHPVDRPDWMVNVTNDAWFGTSAGPRQHLAAARMRAVEEGLPLLRAANTGITAAFDSRGHEISRIGMEETGFRTITLPGPSAPTFFSRFGLIVPGLFALAFLCAGLVGGRLPGGGRPQPTHTQKRHSIPQHET